MLPTAAELLRDWDSARPRSQQQEMGLSEVGLCRRRAGYQLHGFAPDAGFRPGGGMPAILGTAVHEAAAEAARQSVKVPAGAMVEGEVTFAGLAGHPDLFVEPVLRDIKTLGYTMQLDKIRLHGPWKNHLWQLSLYAAGLILQGRKVTTLEINYLTRDSGEEYLWRGPFDMQHVRDAMAWLQQVRTTEPEWLSRDYRPESLQCQSCPFFQRCWADSAVPGRNLRTVLYREWPNAADWARKLEQAQEARGAAEQDIKDSKGALDALRTVERPGESEDVTVPGLDGKIIRFTVTKGAETLDGEQIAADYARAGAVPPRKRGEPQVKITLAVPRD